MYFFFYFLITLFCNNERSDPSYQFGSGSSNLIRIRINKPDERKQKKIYGWGDHPDQPTRYYCYNKNYFTLAMLFSSWRWLLSWIRRPHPPEPSLPARSVPRYTILSSSVCVQLTAGVSRRILVPKSLYSVVHWPHLRCDVPCLHLSVAVF